MACIFGFAQIPFFCNQSSPNKINSFTTVCFLVSNVLLSNNGVQKITIWKEYLAAKA